jgi:hypothetical protein
MCPDPVEKRARLLGGPSRLMNTPNTLGDLRGRFTS